MRELVGERRTGGMDRERKGGRERGGREREGGMEGYICYANIIINHINVAGLTRIT